ncbi:MAG: hypothetical protein ACR2JJ_06935 [Sphingomicrobium sp.]
MLVLVLAVFRPVAGVVPPSEPPVHPLIAYAIYVALAVLLFEWTVRRMSSPWRAAFALGAGQFILVNVDMVLRGDRAFITAAASSVVLVITWASLAVVYTVVDRRIVQGGTE